MRFNKTLDALRQMKKGLRRESEEGDDASKAQQEGERGAQKLRLFDSLLLQFGHDLCEVGCFRLTANSTTNVPRFWLASGTYVFYAQVYTALVL